MGQKKNLELEFGSAGISSNWSFWGGSLKRHALLGSVYMSDKGYADLVFW